MDDDFNVLNKIYSKVLDLLMLNSKDFSLQNFNMYLELLEDILLSKVWYLKI